MADPIVRTSRELARNAGGILREIGASGQPAFITNHGRFVAVIFPLEPGEVESQVLGEMAREIGERLEAERNG